MVLSPSLGLADAEEEEYRVSELILTGFVEHPLALPGFAKKYTYEKNKNVSLSSLCPVLFIYMKYLII